MLQDFQGLFPKSLNDVTPDFGAYPLGGLDDVAVDTVRGLGDFGLVGDELELATILGVIHPIATEAIFLPRAGGLHVP